MKLFRTLSSITLATAIATTLATAPGLAAESEATGERLWSTASHLGFAVVDSSTTGFDKGTGSLMFFDLTRKVAPTVDVGLRSIAQGAKLDGDAFYRLGAGPLVSWRATPRWNIQLTATRFDETGMDADDQATYRSRGNAGLLGWQRVARYGQRIEISWGGFILHHQGDMRPEPAAAGRSANVRSNSGLGHGVEVALRLAL